MIPCICTCNDNEWFHVFVHVFVNVHVHVMSRMHDYKFLHVPFLTYSTNDRLWHTRKYPVCATAVYTERNGILLYS